MAYCVMNTHTSGSVTEGGAGVTIASCARACPRRQLNPPPHPRRREGGRLPPLLGV